MPIYDHTSFNDVKQKIYEAAAPNQKEHLPFLTKINKSSKTVLELLEGPKFIKAYLE